MKNPAALAAWEAKNSAALAAGWEAKNPAALAAGRVWEAQSARK
jgi:hypothetical protein